MDCDVKMPAETSIPLVRLPGLASDKNLAGVHDTAGQACGVDGAQSRAELDDVGPDQRLGEQTCMLPWWGGFMLPCTKKDTFQISQVTTRKAWHCTQTGLSSICHLLGSVKSAN